MATGLQAFYCLWQERRIREKLFDHLSNDDICAVRLANSACCNLVTKRLFLRTHLTFTPNTFTKPNRIQALSRIGHHVEHLTFHCAHSDATFLPPLIHPQTGREISFLYTPHTSMASVLERPKYANSELGDILTQQYPPLFHAATNVPSFMNAMKHLPNMRHLTIKTPGQDPKERYRRDIVDYALISLRISLERAPLTKLSKLSLSGVHPSAINYLRHSPGFGASPSGARRWRQIRKLHLSVESWDFYGPSPGLDHLKIIDDYIRNFAPQLEKFAFTWLGGKGPCPLALSGDPLFAPPRTAKKLFNEVTGPMSPLPPRPSRRPLVMPRLRLMSVRNATMNEAQLRGLVAGHKASVREFDFENVVLVNGGSWDEALAPLMDGEGGCDVWSRHSIGGRSVSSFRPSTAQSGSTGYGTGSSAVTSSIGDEQLPASSAAAAAASRELFDVDLEGMVFGGLNDVDAHLEGVEAWARGVTAAAAQQGGTGSPVVGTIPEVDEKGVAAEDDGGLASDIEAAKQASMAFSTKLKKRRIRKKKSYSSSSSSSHKHHRAAAASGSSMPEDEEDRHRQQRNEQQSSSSSSRTRSRSRHKHSRTRSDETSDRHHSRDGDSRDRSQSRRGHRRHHRHHSEEVPAMPPMPEVIGTDDEAFYRPKTPQPRTPPRTPPRVSNVTITAPILNPDPLPVLLQPAVYDPSAKTGPIIGIVAVETEEQERFTATASPVQDDGLSAVQRRIEADLLAEAEDAAARSSALKRAKEAVLAKLSREFCKRKGYDTANARSGSSSNKDSAAVMGIAGLASGFNLSELSGLNASSSTMGFRIREGFLDSQRSAYVPLMFSRS
ncbi:hypothetical protein B0T17DRAFT_604591 [Bombardia bombarda]|uniref:Uncharacterized protein n=1 Tax=Bombardia bombarda TaxID=252184 RepID=A0AA40CFF2_9PEZI|nr:hypothetical protein B0T17DRAFT_604591 [Bombardia bombarda]